MTQKRFTDRFKITAMEGSFYGMETPAHLPAMAVMLRDDLEGQLDQLLDLFAYEDENGIQLFYFFKSSQLGHTLRLIVKPGEPLYAPSLARIYTSADWLERECYDMFGVHFESHPRLKRLLLYPEFAGHPLRKHYPIDKAQPLIPIYA